MCIDTGAKVVYMSAAVNVDSLLVIKSICNNRKAVRCYMVCR